MTCHEIRSMVSGDPWASDDEGDVDVLFESALFSWLKAMLADVVAVVCGVDYVCLFQYSSSLQFLHELGDDLIDGLQRL